MKLSIITATFNSESTILDCMQSVLDQSYTNIEYILVDGNSTDNTKELIEQCAKNYPNKFVRIISEPDRGIYDALNKGISIATGDIIGFVHSDDMLSGPKIFENILDTFQSGNCDGVYGDLWYVDKNNPKKVIRNWRSRDFDVSLLKKGWMPAHPTLYLRKNVYERFGNFNIQYKIAADYEFILRIFKNDALKFCYLPKVIVHMRMGGESNKSIPKIIRKMKEDYKAIRFHKTGNMITLTRKTTSKLGQFF